MIHSMQFGADPELFVVNSKGRIESAHQYFPPEKKILNSNKAVNAKWAKGLVKRDGPAFELEIGPSYCRDWLVPGIGRQIKYLAKVARGKTLDDKNHRGRHLSIAATAKLSPKSLLNAPEDVSEFGCNPDFSAYLGTEKMPFLEEGDLHRYTGGHIHMAVKPDKTKEKRFEDFPYYANLAILFDYLIGFPSVAILGEIHDQGEAERREKYGQAGSFRIQPHGFEYRTLSGTGFLLHPVLTSLWWGLTKFTISTYGNSSQYNEKLAANLLEANGIIEMDLLREIIDNHDYARAWRLEKKWFKILNCLIPTTSYGFKEFVSTIKLLIYSAKRGISWSNDVEFNWGIKPEWNFSPISHDYWGMSHCMMRLTDELIFPQKKYIDKIIIPPTNPPSRAYKSALIYKHPSTK